MHKFLIHNHGDHVGVATAEIEAGERVVGVFMDDDATVELVLQHTVPLGHKIAIANVAEGGDVLKYNVKIGVSPTGFVAGDYVHTHNLKTARRSRRRPSAIIQKTGTKPVIGVLKPAEAPTNGPGTYFMNTSSAAAECITLMAAAGAVVHFFPTGQGNVIGNAIEPVIKVSANPRTVRTMAEHIDVDVSGLLARTMTLEQAGESLMECLRRTANGRLTAAEALGHREFVMTKLYRSA